MGGEAPVYGDAIIPTRLPKELQVLRPDWLCANIKHNTGRSGCRVAIYSKRHTSAIDEY